MRIIVLPLFGIQIKISDSSPVTYELTSNLRDPDSEPAYQAIVEFIETLICCAAAKGFNVEDDLFLDIVRWAYDLHSCNNRNYSCSPGTKEAK